MRGLLKTMLWLKTAKVRGDSKGECDKIRDL